MKKKDKNKKIYQENEQTHEESCNLTAADIHAVDCKKCNCEYKKRSYKTISWIFLFVLAALVATILAIIIIDIIHK